jgi:hypothetical protein
MDPEPPATPGAYLGATELHDGVVWTWDGMSWTRGRRPGVLRKQARRNRATGGDNDDERDRG